MCIAELPLIGCSTDTSFNTDASGSSPVTDTDVADLVHFLEVNTYANIDASINTGASFNTYANTASSKPQGDVRAGAPGWSIRRFRGNGEEL